MSESLERCDHTDIAVVPCDECEFSDSDHVLRICRDCGEDVDD